MVRRALLFSIVFSLATVGAAVAAFDADRVLPQDPQVRKGRLENGLTYYLRHNDRPAKRAELRLVVNAGSVLEDDDQRGLAHFLEHMEFNGTENFASGDLVDFLESIGSRFGADLNAYTSFDETLYMLEIPTDHEGLLDKGFLVLRDWASRALIAPEEVEKERGVVLDEWRQGLGVRDRLRKIQMPVLLKNSRYAERLPIGDPEIIAHAPAERIRAFYRDWYRPDLMAIVAVGDIDVDAVETLIHDRFGDLEGPPHPRPRTVFDVPPHTEILASAADDPEQSVSQVSINFKRPHPDQGTVGSYRETLLTGLFSAMLNQRFGEISRKPDPPFLFASSSLGSLTRGTDRFAVFATTQENGILPALKAMMTEVARVRAHGFTEAELARAKASLIAAMDRSYSERDKTESNAFVGEYVRNFLTGEPFPGIEYEHDLTASLVPGIDIGEVNAAVEALVPASNTVILASAPRKEGVDLPTSEELVAAATEAAATVPPAYVDELENASFMERLPEPGSVVKRESDEALGTTMVTLSNGVEVWLKPTDFKNDQILFSALAPGGASLAPEADYYSAVASPQVVAEGGMGGHTPTDLQKLLAGKLISVSPTVSDFTYGIRGSSTPADLETALQAVYLVMTAPNRRPESFQVLTDRYRTFVRNRASVPEARYGDRMSVLNHSNHYMYRPWTLEAVDSIDLDTALDFYKKLFADASDLRFYFVGSFQVDAILPLVERYLGSLPSLDDGPPDFGHTRILFPSGITREVVRAGSEPKAHTTITWPAPTSFDEMTLFTMRMATDILEIRLRDRLREDLGSTYSVNVGYSYSPPYPDYSATSVGFGSAPENVDRMVDVVFEEIARFKKDGPTDEELRKVQELDRRAVEKGLRQNGYWLASLQTLDLLGWDPERILHRLDRIDELETETLRTTFASYFPDDRFTVVSLEPETENADGP